MLPCGFERHAALRQDRCDLLRDIRPALEERAERRAIDAQAFDVRERNDGGLTAAARDERHLAKKVWGAERVHALCVAVRHLHADLDLTLGEHVEPVRLCVLARHQFARGEGRHLDGFRQRVELLVC